MKKATRTGMMGSFAVVTPVIAFALFAVPNAFAPAADPTEEVRCTATLDPDTVGVLSDPFEVGYAVPDTISTIETVTAPEESGIQVGTLDTNALTFEIDTSNAIEGDWTLNLVSDTRQSCGAPLTVLMADGGRH